MTKKPDNNHFHKNLLHHYSLCEQGIMQILMQLVTQFTGQLNQSCSSSCGGIVNLFHLFHQQLFSVTYRSVKDTLITTLLTLLYNKNIPIFKN